MQIAHKFKSFLEYTATSERYLKCDVRLKVSFFGDYVIFLINFAIINVNRCIFVLTGLLFFLVSDCPPAWKTDDPRGRCCHFPFTYKLVHYYSCITDDAFVPWCSLGPDFHEYIHSNDQWANCGKKTLIRLELEKLLSYMYYPVISSLKLLMRENGINTNCTLAQFIHDNVHTFCLF